MRACADDAALLGLVSPSLSWQCGRMGNTNDIEKQLTELTTEARDSLDEILATLGRIDGAQRQDQYRQAFEDGMATAAQRISWYLRKEETNAQHGKQLASAIDDEHGRTRAHAVSVAAGAWAQRIKTGEWLQDDEERIETVCAGEVKVGDMVDITNDGEYRQVTYIGNVKKGFVSMVCDDRRALRARIAKVRVIRAHDVIA